MNKSPQVSNRELFEVWTQHISPVWVSYPSLELGLYLVPAFQTSRFALSS
jgi:hypothetical protein